MTLNQAKDLIKSMIESKENEIKKRKRQIDGGKFETLTSLIEVEIKNLHNDIEFLKSLELEFEVP